MAYKIKEECLGNNYLCNKIHCPISKYNNIILTNTLECYSIDMKKTYICHIVQQLFFLLERNELEFSDYVQFATIFEEIE